jgi:hypothetical protein
VFKSQGRAERRDAGKSRIGGELQLPLSILRAAAVFAAGQQSSRKRTGMPTLPEDLQLLIHAMDAADRAAERLATQLNDTAFFWRPDATRWSVALCLDHLAVTNAIYGKAIAGAIATAQERGWSRRGPAAPGFFGRKFVATLEPPVKRRAPAPGKITPRAARSREAILEAYYAAHDDIRDGIRAAATLDVNRATFRNPFFPLFTVKVSSGFHVVAAHDRRHLWQAEQVERALQAADGA